MALLFLKKKEVQFLSLIVSIEKEIKKNGIGDYISNFIIMDTLSIDTFKNFCIDYSKNFAPCSEDSSVCLYTLPAHVLPQIQNSDKIDFLQKKTFKYIDRKKIIPEKEMSFYDIVNTYIPNKSKGDIENFKQCLTNIKSGQNQNYEQSLQIIISLINKYFKRPEITRLQCELINEHHLTQDAFTTIMLNLKHTNYYYQKIFQNDLEIKPLTENGKILPIQKLYIMWAIFKLNKNGLNIEMIKVKNNLETIFKKYNNNSLEDELKKRGIILENKLSREHITTNKKIMNN